ncbi:MAG: hypothetical protein Q4B18_02630 [Bacillota bacterium]|nr:hypothetical protein [Bacillota bacterium]
MLVAPRYTFIPKQERILEFKGYNKKSVIDDGEMRNMYNLSSDEYPCLYQRKPRGIYSEAYKNPTAMIVKDKKLAVISEGQFYYDGTLYPALKLSDKTQMVAINTRICFFPEKMFFNVKTGEVGNLSSNVVSETTMTLTVTSAVITFPTSQGFDSKFAVGDAVQITASDERLNVSAVIQSLTDTSIIFQDETFIDVTAEGQTEMQIEVTNIEVARNCPDLDYVMESNNRLWGVSNTDNTIYACKLGDPTNWGYFQNTTMDSYYAEQGTDGEWTGCAAYSTHLLFFKEDYIHKVYGSKPSTYQIETAQCHALEKGSSKSIAIINETVLYKSRLGIMAYAGGVPRLISDNFGTDVYTDAIAGTDGIKYYVSVRREGSPELLVFDMERFMWHKEDSVRARDFAYHNGKLLFINDADNKIYEMASDNPMASETDIEWYAELGPFDEYLEDKKVYSQLKMRLSFAKLSELTVSISIDGGEWEVLSRFVNDRDKTEMLPIVPRRCDKFAIKLEGKGYCKIESLVRSYRQGSAKKGVRL